MKPIYVDIDGTISNHQSMQGWKTHGINQSVLSKVKRLITEGKEIVIWSGSTQYATAFCKEFGINPVASIGKPSFLVDNEIDLLLSRLKKNIMSPNDFIKRDF